MSKVNSQGEEVIDTTGISGFLGILDQMPVPYSFPIQISTSYTLLNNRQIIAGRFEFTGSGEILLQGTASIYLVGDS